MLATSHEFPGNAWGDKMDTLNAMQVVFNESIMQNA